MEGPEYTYNAALEGSDTSVDADPKRIKALEMINDLIANFSDTTFGVEEGTQFADQRAYWRERRDVELTESVRLIQIEMAVNTCLYVLLQIRKGVAAGAGFTDTVADIEDKKIRLEQEMVELIRNPTKARGMSYPFKMWHPDAFEFIIRGYIDMVSHMREIAAGSGDQEDKRELVLTYVTQKLQGLQNIKAVLKDSMEALDDKLLMYSDDIISARKQKKDIRPSQN